MKEITCSIAGITYKLEYHKINTADNLSIYEGILYQNPPLIFSLTASKNGGIYFSPMQTPLTVQEAVKSTIEINEKADFGNYC